jgi:hypothetical protein
MISLVKIEESLLLPDGFCVAANGVRPNTCPDPLTRVCGRSNEIKCLQDSY